MCLIVSVLNDNVSLFLAAIKRKYDSRGVAHVRNIGFVR